MALARLGAGDEATEMFHALNPINHTRTVDDVEHYKAEPYVVAGDVYARPPHAGRAGWSWYTGSAAWMYRVGVESILGLRRSGNAFTVDPCIPASWPGYEMRWRVQGTEYRISVENPAGQCRGVVSVVVDGVEEPTRMVPLVHNGGTRHVRVVLGSASG
jgi:cyclic beta-1,2-glucan synthetase